MKSRPEDDIADRLKLWRKSVMEMTQEQFGLLCDVTKSMVSQWESDTVVPSTDCLLKLKSRLEFSVDWVLSGTICDYADVARPAIRTLLKVAEPLSDDAVAALTRVGDSYAELLERKKP